MTHLADFDIYDSHSLFLAQKAEIVQTATSATYHAGMTATEHLDEAAGQLYSDLRDIFGHTMPNGTTFNLAIVRHCLREMIFTGEIDRTKEF